MSFKSNNKSTGRREWAIRNYLNNKEVCKDNREEQQFLIQDFYNENGGKNADGWPAAVLYASEHFGMFGDYIKRVIA